MKLSTILNPKLIFMGGKLNNKNQIINFMLDAIITESGGTIDKNATMKLIEKREALGGTEFPNNMCIPHARIDKFDRLVTAIYIPEKPVRGDSIKIEEFVLFVIGKSATDLYLKALSSIIGVKHDLELFRELRSAKDGDGFIEIMSKSNIRVKKETLAGDIATIPATVINQNETIGAAADILYKKRLSYIPVVDDNNILVGELSTLDIVKQGIPNYDLLINDLKYLSSFDPFEAFLEMEDQITVKKIMHKVSKTLSEKSTIVETSIALVQSNLRQLPIINDDHKIIGVVSISDILGKIIRG